MAKKIAKKIAAKKKATAKKAKAIVSPTMREVILQAIKDSGMSVNAIAKATGEEGGVSQPSLSRFVNGERDLLLDTADKVAKVLGLKLVKDDSAG